MPKQTSRSHSIDLFAIAHQSMIEEGFLPDFSAVVKIEVDSLARNPPELSAPAVRDMRPLLWSSIDDSKSRDLDQVEYAGVRTFPMLPEQLSTDLTSLVAGEDRLAVVTEMVVAPDGTVKTTDFYRATINNYAKLAYESVGDWLAGKARVPEGIKKVPGLERA